MEEKRFQTIIGELQFRAGRSQGPGGQHVNKVSTRVEIRFNIRNSKVLTVYEKNLLEHCLGSRMNKEGEIILASQLSRSQVSNREDALRRLYLVLNRVLTPKKERIATRPTRRSIRKRLEDKKRISQKKQWRNKPEL